MVCTINFINDKTGNFGLYTNDGYYTICHTKELNMINVDDSIEFDNTLDCYYFYNIEQGDRISAKVIDIGLTYSQAQRFYK